MMSTRVSNLKSFGTVQGEETRLNKLCIELLI